MSPEEFAGKVFTESNPTEVLRLTIARDREMQIAAVRDLLVRYEAQCGGEFRSTMEARLRELQEGK